MDIAKSGPQHSAGQRLNNSCQTPKPEMKVVLLKSIIFPPLICNNVYLLNVKFSFERKRKSAGNLATVETWDS